MHTSIPQKRVSLSDMIYLLIAFSPFVDTINGYIMMVNHIGATEATGFSFGAIYRIALMVLILLNIQHTQKRFFWLILFSYFPVSALLRSLLQGGYGAFGAISYGIKWIFPVLILFFLEDRNRIHPHTTRSLFITWSWLIPSILIVEYLLGIGEAAYFDAGFRGLFFCNNDIGFSLTMLCIFSMYRFFDSLQLKTIFPLVLNLFAIVILSTKSCILFAALSFICFWLHGLDQKPRKILVLTLSGLAALLILSPLIWKIIRGPVTAMLSRYYSYYTISVSTLGSSLSGIMNFLTSSRSIRIANAFARIMQNNLFINLLFGWLPPINLGAIEMDWLDAFFQHGIIGIFILLLFYGHLFTKKNYPFPYPYMMLIAMICAFFSGHVINGALPSTVLSAMLALALDNRNNTKSITPLHFTIIC